MKYKVILLPEAREDIWEIFLYMAENDSLQKAENLLDALEDRCNALQHMPQRGHKLSELKFINVAGFQEIHVKPYRIIYQITGQNVYIHAVLDGRRTLQDLLERRLLR
jgi:toxin ParE1/3/4